jgi:hypothetical protein
LEFFVNNRNKIRIDNSRAITPPSLLGMERKIAYANKKYHSGWICTGVTRGFAGVKLSGSIRIKGTRRLINMKRKKIILALVRSFREKYG